jgi:hypothetical protein
MKCYDVVCVLGDTKTMATPVGLMVWVEWDDGHAGCVCFDEWLRVEREHERSLVGFPAISRRFGVPRSVLVTVGR